MRPRKGGSDGLRGLPGLPGPPGLSGPGARPGKGEETGCRACLGFPGLPAFLTQGCGWGKGRRRPAGPARVSRAWGVAENKGKGRAAGLLGDVSFGEGVSARGGSRGTGGGGLRGLPGFPELPGLSGPGARPGNGETTACGAFRGFRAARPSWPRGAAGERGGDGLRGLPGFSGPLGLGVWTRTKEKARAAGLLGNVSFGEGVSARGDSRGTGGDGLRGLLGFPELPGLPGPGAAWERGNDGLRGLPGFPGRPAFLAQGCGWGTGRRWFAGPARVSRASRPFRPRGAAGERGGDGLRGLPGFPGLPVWGYGREQRKRPAGRAWWGTFRLEKAFPPEGMVGEGGATACGARRAFRVPPAFLAQGCGREQRKRPAGAGLAEGALPGGGGIKGRRPAGPSGFGIRG